MRPELPQLPDDNSLDETRLTETGQTRDMPAVPPQNRPSAPPSRLPQERTQPIQPLPPAQRPPSTYRPNPNTQQGRLVQPPPSQHVQRVARRGSARERRDNGLYLPLWSLALMLIVVIGITGGIVLLVISLGGRSAPESPPVILVSSPVATQRPAEFPVVPATATIPPQFDPNVSGTGGSAPEVASGETAGGANSLPTAPATFALSGPTLPPVIFTPTPRSISIGERVLVIDVGDQQLNVRDNPGVAGTSILFRVVEGTEFVIVDGPRQADGLTWWRIQSPLNQSQIGWAASNYLEIAPPTTEG
ncbi:MAG: hypothetical protein OHK0046_03410 [Anaerolineae bacterium]